MKYRTYFYRIIVVISFIIIMFSNSRAYAANKDFGKMPTIHVDSVGDMVYTDYENCVQYFVTSEGGICTILDASGNSACIMDTDFGRFSSIHIDSAGDRICTDNKTNVQYLVTVEGNICPIVDNIGTPNISQNVDFGRFSSIHIDSAGDRICTDSETNIQYLITAKGDIYLVVDKFGTPDFSQNTDFGRFSSMHIDSMGDMVCTDNETGVQYLITPEGCIHPIVDRFGTIYYSQNTDFGRFSSMHVDSMGDMVCTDSETGVQYLITSEGDVCLIVDRFWSPYYSQNTDFGRFSSIHINSTGDRICTDNETNIQYLVTAKGDVCPMLDVYHHRNIVIMPSYHGYTFIYQ